MLKKVATGTRRANEALRRGDGHCCCDPRGPQVQTEVVEPASYYLALFALALP